MTKSTKKILVTEDERPIARALQLKLESTGFDVDVASNGQQAVDFLSKGSYDMMILDLVMPVMDGFATLEKMHEMENKTPVFVLSNLSQPEDEKKVRLMGAVDFAVKSNVPLSDIVERITKKLQ
jgi:DNA-binding response OmpR family regulator